jgi:hypothetical protein
LDTSSIFAVTTAIATKASFMATVDAATTRAADVAIVAILEKRRREKAVATLDASTTTAAVVAIVALAVSTVKAKKESTSAAIAIVDSAGAKAEYVSEVLVAATTTAAAAAQDD